MKHWRIILTILIILAAAGVWKRAPLGLGLRALGVPKTTLAERAELIASGIDLRLPEAGAAPYPVVLQFHGCAGVRPAFQDQWAKIANDAGYAAMIVDSTGPRGISRDEALKTVCAGKTLLGQERAGDVAAAVSLAAADPRLDQNRIILTGWSHGAWTIMDYQTTDLRRRPPTGIVPENWDLPSPEAVVLFYPYCGFGTLSRFRPWRETPPTLALIAGADTVVDAEECIRTFEKREAAGDPVRHIVYPGAQHAFDDPFLEPAWIHWHDPAAFENAKEKYAGFLEEISAKTAP